MRLPREGRARTRPRHERDILQPVKRAVPEASTADIWTLAGRRPSRCVAVLRSTMRWADATRRPVQSARLRAGCRTRRKAPMLRDAYRMGFDDREIVALSGAHTLGRCHKVRSGFDGPWTSNPLKFDGEYFRNLMTKDWVPRDWDGPLQYTDAESHSLTMLPSDLALKEDPAFAVYASKYAADESLFFEDFKKAFEKLISMSRGERRPTILTTPPRRCARSACTASSTRRPPGALASTPTPTTRFAPRGAAQGGVRPGVLVRVVECRHRAPT